VGVVLRGLPMRAICHDDATRCYSDAFRAMPRGGAIIQYTYNLRPPVDPRRAAQKLKATFAGREWQFPADAGGTGRSCAGRSRRFGCSRHGTVSCSTAR